MLEAITVGANGLALTREAIAEISSTLRQLLADRTASVVPTRGLVRIVRTRESSVSSDCC
jgi:hypothetical protein